MQTMDSGLCGHKISRTLMEAFLQSWCDRGWPHARVFDFGILPGTGSIRAASVKSTGQGGGVSAAIWVNRRIHGRIQTCHCIVHRASSIEHRASSIFCWFNLSHPAAIKSALWLWILCAISSANVVQKRVKSEFRGIRPLTTNNLPVLRVHHCLLLVPGTWYLVLQLLLLQLLGWLTGEGRFYLQVRNRYSGSRYQVLYWYQVPGTEHHMFRTVATAVGQ
jgi:hypothetical protein